MSKVTETASMTKAQQATLRLRCQRQAAHIEKMKQALQRIQRLAIGNQDIAIKIVCDAALQKPTAGSGNE